MTAPNVSTGAPVIYGLSSPGGTEETPELRYEESDKDGVRKITAVLTRKIHCLKRYAESIKQSAAFSGQIVEVNGVIYGANWICRNVNAVPAGEASIVQIESFREGVTPFEWGLPPGLSVEMEDGVASLYYWRTTGEKVLQLRWDSLTGEDRYGWRVDYLETNRLTYANAYGAGRSVPIYSVGIYYEGVKVYHVDGEDALASLSNAFVDFTAEHVGRVSNGSVYPTQESAQQAGDAALEAWVDGLLADIADGPDFTNYGTRFQSGIVWIDETAAAATAVDASAVGASQGVGWVYRLTVPARRVIANVDAWKKSFAEGLKWESVVDRVETSSTHLHVFYRLVFANVVLVSIDVTAAEGSA